jgi:hypothetical protein
VARVGDENHGRVDRLRIRPWRSLRRGAGRAARSAPRSREVEDALSVSGGVGALRSHGLFTPGPAGERATQCPVRGDGAAASCRHPVAGRGLGAGPITHCRRRPLGDPEADRMMVRRAVRACRAVLCRLAPGVPRPPPALADARHGTRGYLCIGETWPRLIGRRVGEHCGAQPNP